MKVTREVGVMNIQANEVENNEVRRVRKALPKSKALANNSWQVKGGNGSYGSVLNASNAVNCRFSPAPTPAAN